MAESPPDLDVDVCLKKPELVVTDPLLLTIKL